MNSVKIRLKVLLMLCLANLVLLVGFTNASHQLRSFEDKRELQAQIPPPPNDDCTDALIVPSNFPGATYTAPGVSIVNTMQLNVKLLPPHFCYLISEHGKIPLHLWYKFAPSTTSFYGISTNLGDAHIAAYRTTKCNNLILSNCLEARPSFDLMLTANRSYYFFVQPAFANSTRSLQLIVQRRRPPSNNLCTNATIIDPTEETVLTVPVYDSAFALHDTNADFPFLSGSKVCTEFESTCCPRPTFWYQLINPLSTPLSVDVTVDAAKVTSWSIGIIKGTNCSALRCIAGVHKSYFLSANHHFIAEPGTFYYILVKLETYQFGGPIPFNVTIKGRKQFFMVIDSERDEAIQLLKDNIDYYSWYKINSVNLNLRARFAISPESIKSVRLTYDNPKRIRCDQKAPYSVFGDLNGDYNNATLQLGWHRVTATPYTLPNCTGDAGALIAQDFRVTGCPTIFVIGYDATGNEVWLSPFTSALASQDGYTHTKLPVKLSLQCRINLFMYIDCGFPVQSVRIELRNARTGTLIRKSNTFQLIQNNHLPAGSYSLRAIIMNVTHPTMNFTVVNTTCD